MVWKLEKWHGQIRSPTIEFFAGKPDSGRAGGLELANQDKQRYDTKAFASMNRFPNLSPEWKFCERGL